MVHPMRRLPLSESSAQERRYFELKNNAIMSGIAFSSLSGNCPLSARPIKPPLPFSLSLKGRGAGVRGIMRAKGLPSLHHIP